MALTLLYVAATGISLTSSVLIHEIYTTLVTPSSVTFRALGLLWKVYRSRKWNGYIYEIFTLLYLNVTGQWRILQLFYLFIYLTQMSIVPGNWFPTYCSSVSHITPLSLSSHIINYLQISISCLFIYFFLVIFAAILHVMQETNYTNSTHDIKRRHYFWHLKLDI